MANITTSPGLISIDPVQGLVDYVQEIKPFHTKVFEVLFEYVYEDIDNTTITDVMVFAWGGDYPLTIDAAYVSGNLIPVSGDYSNAVFPLDIVHIDSNPSTDVTAVMYDSLNDLTWITVTDPTGAAVSGTITIENVDITPWYQFSIVDATSSPNATLTVSGNATADVQVSAVFNISGSVSNDGSYKATYALYEPINDQTVIGVAPISGNTPIVLAPGASGQVVPPRYVP